MEILCGPCVIESETHALATAKELKKIFETAGVGLIYKSSFDKANRSSIEAYRGPGLEEGLRILSKVKEETGLRIVTDVHTPEEAKRAGEVVDFLQIPAFLCRQTDLLVAAGKTGKPINVKKGQFMAPWDMKYVAEKIASTGNQKIMLTDRGTTFGYNNLVCDMRAIPIMKELGYPVCFDATHAIQLPGGEGHCSGGQREFIPVLAKAAVAAGADFLFMEAHPDPEKALCDASSVLPFAELPKLLNTLQKIYDATRA